ncbi:hypothetical protein IKF21_01685 [Candidatus Saccharibacteria bacterium]|nr:hypothetical protein [Candidatus Saccharibacteria bacterium]
MHVIDEIKADAAGRISIAKLFDEMPSEVLVLYDTEERAIFLRGDITGDWSVAQRKVDSKNRIVLPKWMRERLGDEYYLVSDSKERHYLLVKKFFD